MKQRTSMTFALCLAALPMQAQEGSTSEPEDAFSLMEEGARMLMRGFIAEMEPAIEELQQSVEAFGPAMAEFVQSVGPAFAELIEQVDDLRNYEAPEFLPNGDIIMRRLPDAPVWTPNKDEAEIEL